MASGDYVSPVVRKLRRSKIKAHYEHANAMWSKGVVEMLARYGMPAPDLNVDGYRYRALLKESISVPTDSVFVGLPTPYTVTPTEVEQIALEVLSVPPESFSRAYERFVARVAFEETGCFFRRLDPVTVARVDKDDLPFIDDEAGFDYEFASGIMLRYGGLVPSGSVDDPGEIAMCDLRLYVEGRATQAALREAERDIIATVKTTMLIFGHAGYLNHSAIPEGNDLDPEEMDALSKWRRRLFTDVLDMCFDCKEGGAAEIGWRVRNAILMLVEADRSSHPLLQITLSMAAIEALVCGDRENISETLARNVATLLVPKSSDRPDAFVLVKKLYGIRSKFIHGSKVDRDASSEQARRLASACVVASLAWREFVRRLGCDVSDMGGDFVEVLRDAGMRGVAMLGVPDSLQRLLPRK